MIVIMIAITPSLNASNRPVVIYPSGYALVNGKRGLLTERSVSTSLTRNWFSLGISDWMEESQRLACRELVSISAFQFLN